MYSINELEGEFDLPLSFSFAELVLGKSKSHLKLRSLLPDGQDCRLGLVAPSTCHLLQCL